MRICFFQHVPYEGPGTIAEWAAARGHVLEGVELYRGGAPSSPLDFDALVVMGGPMNVGDEGEHPWLRDEKRLLERWIDAGKPVLGICLGAQLVAEALGAKVKKNKVSEIGWFPVRRLPQLSVTSYDGILPASMDVLHWHGDTFAIPDQAISILTSDACANQGFAYRDRVLALQCHLEMDEASLRTMLEHTEQTLVPGEWVQSAEEMLAAGPRYYSRMRSTFFSLLDAWVEG